jgi:hypothetical protein
MPIYHQHHLVDRDAARTFLHAFGAGVCGLGKDRNHQRRLSATVLSRSSSRIGEIDRPFSEIAASGMALAAAALASSFCFGIERGGALGPPFGKAVRDGKPEPPFGTHHGEDRSRQKIILETAPCPAAINPYVAGPPALPQMNEHRHFPGA